MHSHLSNKSGAVSWCCISCRVQTPAKYLMLGGGNPLIVVRSKTLQIPAIATHFGPAVNLF